MNKAAEGLAQATSEKLGQALRQLRKGTALSQVDLANKLGVDQTAVSRWELGKDAFPAAIVPAIEDAMGYRPGVLWATAGLVELPTVSAAIYADENLTVDQKRAVIGTYEAFTAAPRRRRLS